MRARAEIYDHARSLIFAVVSWNDGAESDRFANDFPQAIAPDIVQRAPPCSPAHGRGIADERHTRRARQRDQVRDASALVIKLRFTACRSYPTQAAGTQGPLGGEAGWAGAGALRPRRRRGACRRSR